MKYQFTTVLLVIVPVAANVLLAITAFVFNPADFSGDVAICYITALTALGAAATSFIGFAIHDLGPARTMVAVTAQGATMIFTFAGIYRGHGLLYGGSPHALIDDAASALYFSIVTWTTLGFGDFTPPPPLRLITALQALLGYVFLGTSVGLGTYLMCQDKLNKT